MTSTSITLLGLVLSGAIKFIPSQIIPISGMIASNSMVAIGLCYKQMKTKFHDEHQRIEEKLALGAQPFQACSNIVQTCVKTGMQPTIDSAKTYGIVSLPGMMSGLIFAESTLYLPSNTKSWSSSCCFRQPAWHRFVRHI